MRKTEQEVYESFQAAIAQQDESVQGLYRHIPANWEEVPEEQKAIFEVMAFRLNTIPSDRTNPIISEWLAEAQQIVAQARKE